MNSQVEQAHNRATDEIPTVEDFIILRRRTIGGPIVEGAYIHVLGALHELSRCVLAMVEYSLDLQIPEYVWDHPILQEMSKAVIDIMTWPNVRAILSCCSQQHSYQVSYQDLCSFNVRVLFLFPRC